MMDREDDITTDSLLVRIGARDAPVCLDLCLDEDHAAWPRLIPGARRWAFDDVEALVPGLSGHEVVTICQKGRKISHGAAALLRARGVAARALRGGMVAWRAAGAPTMAAAALPPSRRWVASSGPDLPGLHWLIRRFVDRDACLLVVPGAEAAEVATRFRATRLPGTAGDALGLLDLDLPSAARVAGALPDAVARGLAVLHPDPLARAEAALPVFDALWAAAGQERPA